MTRNLLLLFALALLLTLPGCSDDKSNTLSVNPATVNIHPNGGTATITIQTNATSWSINNSGADWLTLSSTEGSGGSSPVTLAVTTKTLEPRTGTLTVTAGSAKPVEVIVSQGASDFLFNLTANPTTINFDQAGGTRSLNITTSAAQWSLDTDLDWLQFNTTTGNSGSTSVTITANENSAEEARNGVITITAEHAPTLEIPVTQSGPLYPNYNISPLAPDATGMSSNANALAANINLGWNLGNSLEAIGGETAWGNPAVTKAFIDVVKQNGFNAVRIPCSWNQHMVNSNTAQIKTDWLNRVKEVIQYCIDNDMYVLLNIHWDGGWLENNVTPDKQTENNAKQKAFWEQIATHLRDFDEHLLFASANEPNVENAEQMAVLNSYHQTFIDAVRSTGGRNTYRVLVIQGPSTDIEKTNNLMTTLPVDPTEDRLMVEVHYYTPWNFCGLEKDESWGNMFYYWGEGHHSATDPSRNATWGEEETVDANFALMKEQFVDNGIPVVLGEYSAMRRSTLTGDDLTLHLASRAYYLKYVTAKAKENGLLPFYWDNGGTGNHGSGIFNRNNNTVADQQALDALIEGVE